MPRPGGTRRKLCEAGPRRRERCSASSSRPCSSSERPSTSWALPASSSMSSRSPMISSAWRACSSAREGVAGAKVDLRHDETALAASSRVRSRARPRTRASDARPPARACRAGSRGRRGCSAAARRSRGRRAPRTAPWPLGIGAGEHPVAVAFGQDRSLEIGLPEGAPSCIASASRAHARHPRARPRSRAGGGSSGTATRRSLKRGAGRTGSRALGEHQRLVEEGDRGRDAGEETAADADALDDLGAVDVGELGRSTSARGSASWARPAFTLAGLCERDAFPVQRSNVQLDGAGAQHGRRAFRTPRARRRTDARRARSPRGPGSPRRVPARRRRRRSRGTTGRRRGGARATRSCRRWARLPALDLGDVLLGEAIARELWVRPAPIGGLPQPLAEPGYAKACRCGLSGSTWLSRAATSHPGTHSLANTSLIAMAPFRHPSKGA